jgi:UPF0271 protein
VTVVDLNADVGEWDDEAPADERDLLTVVTSANVACGVHAGNPAVMAATVAFAAAHGVAVGAHPSLDDRAHFGRRELDVPPGDLLGLVRTQVERLARIAALQGIRLTHVKPHGALYNMAARDAQLADAIATAVAECDRRLVLVGLSGSALLSAGQRAGLRTASEVFADRGYLANGSLASRGTTGAVITDVEIVAARAVAMVLDRVVSAIDGTPVSIDPATICIHGDTPGAPRLARRLRSALENAGITVMAYH